MSRSPRERARRTDRLRAVLFACGLALGLIAAPADSGTPGVALPVPPADAIGNAAADQPADVATDYTFGVFPYLPPLTIDRIFAPIMQNLGEGLGRSVNLRTKDSFAAFLTELGRGTYDFAFVHPYFYVEAVDRHDYLPVVRLNEQLTAVVVAREAVPAPSVEALRGKILALPPALAAVTELMRGELMAAGIAPGRDVTIRHFQSKASCLHAIEVGDAYGCGLPRFALRQLPPEETKDLHVVFESAPVAGIAIVAHERLPEAVRARLQSVILGWPATETGRAILAGAEWPGFVVAVDADYDPVRRRIAAGAFTARQLTGAP